MAKSGRELAAPLKKVMDILFGVTVMGTVGTLIGIIMGGGIMPLARATIASYLNARRFAPDYALTPKKVIDMFNAVYVGGTYRVNDTTYWGANEVQAYFETLYR